MYARIGQQRADALCRVTPLAAGSKQNCDRPEIPIHDLILLTSYGLTPLSSMNLFAQ
jgi:hypothetical protein